MKVCEKICKDCPFRRKHPAGWMGSNHPWDHSQSALSDESVGCHSSFPQDGYENKIKFQIAEKRAPRCRGALTFMRNIGKVPRNKEMRKLADSVKPDKKNCFATLGEFLKHHLNATVKSWEF